MPSSQLRPTKKRRSETETLNLSEEIPSPPTTSEAIHSTITSVITGTILQHLVLLQVSFSKLNTLKSHDE